MLISTPLTSRLAGKSQSSQESRITAKNARIVAICRIAYAPTICLQLPLVVALRDRPYFMKPARHDAGVPRQKLLLKVMNWVVSIILHLLSARSARAM